MVHQVRLRGSHQRETGGRWFARPMNDGGPDGRHGQLPGGGTHTVVHGGWSATEILGGDG
jgi:hypothetical protein